jgi:hypothetical protein
LSFIWATRGRTWGFRFLRNGGFDDPLPIYRSAFADVFGQPEVCRRVGDFVALRFADPSGRRDRSGRPISHDFVIPEVDAEGIRTVAAGQALMWPKVQGDYATIWDQERPSPLDG